MKSALQYLAMAAMVGVVGVEAVAAPAATNQAYVIHQGRRELFYPLTASSVSTGRRDVERWIEIAFPRDKVAFVLSGEAIPSDLSRAVIVDIEPGRYKGGKTSEVVKRGYMERPAGWAEVTTTYRVSDLFDLKPAAVAVLKKRVAKHVAERTEKAGSNKRRCGKGFLLYASKTDAGWMFVLSPNWNRGARPDEITRATGLAGTKKMLETLAPRQEVHWLRPQGTTNAAPRPVLRELAAHCWRLGLHAEGFPVTAAEEVLFAVERGLAGIVKGLKPAPRVNRNGRSVMFGYKTRSFTVHTSDKLGRRSKKALEMVGPSRDGLMVRVSLVDKRYAGAAEIPQEMRQPYWTSYVNAYPVLRGRQHLYLFMTYGRRTDRAVVNRIEALLQSLADNGPESRPIVPKAHNPALKRGSE
jgi:hypothetical protein